jgi:hypothetical protein
MNRQLIESIPWDMGAYQVKSYMERTYGRRGSIGILNRLTGVIRDPKKREIRDQVIAQFHDELPKTSQRSNDFSYHSPIFGLSTSSDYSNIMKLESPSPKPHLDRTLSSGSTYIDYNDRKETSETMQGVTSDWERFSSNHPVLSTLVGGVLLGGVAMAGTYAVATGQPVHQNPFKVSTTSRPEY